MNDKTSATLVFIALLLLYVGSYCALVEPGSAGVIVRNGISRPIEHYRHFNNLAAMAFWPLEKLDRKLRPDSWPVSPLKIEINTRPPRQPQPATEPSTLLPG
ncbi:hypothetical protein ETAA8_16010 [Anatilimnocola aggregata]|uniref:Uncharacterized protein n=1 Tax=Anatilimnocola aggregata TaxID=2528021 RepID=A0A517Y8H6_9BACT|nr:hypothetical protein ETAA8_16010 [Anatilimnocola aggregata]